MPGDFKQIAVLLDRLVQGAAAADVAADDVTTFDSASPPPVSYWTMARGFRVPPQHSPGLTADHLREVAIAVAQGEVSFFLGAAVHNTRLLGNQFYEMLGARLDVPPADRNRADVAELIIDSAGRRALSNEIADIVASHYNRPWFAHQMIAALATRPPADPDRRLIAFTTNYDDVLERTLTAAGVAHHLLLYQPDGLHAGQFLHRPPTGRLQAILNPEGIYTLDDGAPVVVKLNGGLDPLREVRGRFVVASADFSELAARIPAMLPRVIKQALRMRSLLFVGHGLLEPDVRAFARYARKQRGDRPSWAVQNVKRDEALWRVSYGVDIREADLDTYLQALHRTLKEDFGVET
jgi:hypothetical protein